MKELKSSTKATNEIFPVCLYYDQSTCACKNTELKTKHCLAPYPVMSCYRDRRFGHNEDLFDSAVYIEQIEKEMNSDPVNHPNHYTRGGIECIKAIEASMTPEGFQDYCKGNVMKYIWRWREKNGLEDLKKAQVYLNWLIDSKERQDKA